MGIEWELAILRVYDLQGGFAWNKEVFNAVADLFAYQKGRSKGLVAERQAFHDQIQNHIGNLRNMGQLDMVCSGYHRLTAKGKARLQSR
jgi:hypothetical protein